MFLVNDQELLCESPRLVFSQYDLKSAQIESTSKLNCAVEDKCQQFITFLLHFEVSVLIAVAYLCYNSDVEQDGYSKTVPLFDSIAHSLLI